MDVIANDLSTELRGRIERGATFGMVACSDIACGSAIGIWFADPTASEVIADRRGSVWEDNRLQDKVNCLLC